MWSSCETFAKLDCSRIIKKKAFKKARWQFYIKKDNKFSQLRYFNSFITTFLLEIYEIFNYFSTATATREILTLSLSLSSYILQVHIP